MAEKDLQRAQKVFDSLCDTLDADDWHYKKDEEKLRIECGAQGDDLPIDIIIKVDAERQIIMLLSHLSFTIPDEKRIETAIAISVVNDLLVDGSFDYDITNGHIFFRMTSSFIDSDIGSDLFMYLLLVSCHTVDEYNDKFLMFSKGAMSLQDFLSDN